MPAINSFLSAEFEPGSVTDLPKLLVCYLSRKGNDVTAFTKTVVFVVQVARERLPAFSTIPMPISYHKTGLGNLHSKVVDTS